MRNLQLTESEIKDLALIVNQLMISAEKSIFAQYRLDLELYSPNQELIKKMVKSARSKSYERFITYLSTNHKKRGSNKPFQYGQRDKTEPEDYIVGDFGKGNNYEN